MNRTTFSLEQILNEFPEVENLGDLFRRVENKLASQGQIVCRFCVNDLDLSEGDESRIALAPIDEIKTLAVESESPVALLFKLIQNWIEELPTLIQSADKLAKDIRFEGIEGKLKSFIDLVDSCQFLIESLMNLESILKKESANLDHWQKNKTLTARAIGNALQAFEKKDFVQLSEVLEYDLGNSLQEWLEEIVRMRDYLKQENGKDSQQFSERIFEKRSQANSLAGPGEHTS